VDDREPVDVEADLCLTRNIYMDGEILISFKISGDDYIEDQATDAPMSVFGAAIQEVTDSEGVVTKYLVAALCGYTIISGQTVSYKGPTDYLYRAPMDDLENYELTENPPECSLIGGGNQSDTPWSFNSLGNEAVTLRDQDGDAYKMTISDEGAVTGERIFYNFDSGIYATQVGYKSPLNFGELDRWDAEGPQVIGIGYKDDKIRYAKLYHKIWEETELNLVNPKDPARDTNT